ncbi:unnamed protein product [Blepharisma stoltei]|uniref:Uncharacterized protein n=1 Tax=Blepharisma stoltei TaxID=1481888 RepID=A0AAU9J6W4_9CILI|nr:unnamed protein product [Blepharisma stoltei]
MWRLLIRNFSRIGPTLPPVPRIEEARGLNEFVRAIEYINAKRYQMAEIELNLCLEILKNGGLFAEPAYNFTLKKLAFVYKQQNKTKQCEKALKDIVKHYESKAETYPDLFLAAQETLAMYLLEADVGRCVDLCREVLANTPSEFFHYLFGISLVLKGEDFITAKEHLQALVLNKDPQPEVLYNFAYAQLVHPRKFTNPNKLNTQEIKENRNAVIEYVHAIPNFKKAIQYFENLSEPYEPNPDNPGLKKKESGLVLTTLAEMGWGDGLTLQETAAWLKCALKLYEEVDKTKLGRVLTLTGRLLRDQKQFLHAEGLLSNAMSILEGRGDWDEALVCEEYGGLLNKISKRENEGEQLIAKAKLIRSKLPFWAERAAHMFIPKWTLEMQPFTSSPSY